MVGKENAAVVEQKAKLLDFAVNNDLSVSLHVSGSVWVIVLIMIIFFLAVKIFGSNKIQTLELDEAEIGVGLTVPLNPSQPECGNWIISGHLPSEYRRGFLT